jgi:hypothetical protein
MKAITFSILTLLAALPAAAIGNGGCCAKVNGVCISKCTQPGGCTGNADCRLAFKTSGQSSGVDLQSPAGRFALATLDSGDQARLREITGTSRPTPEQRPMQDTPQGLVSLPAPTGTPTLSQLGGATAKVPMKHGSCGLDCGIHVLATQSGNLDVPARIGMTCPAGTSVNAVEYQLAGQGVTAVVGAGTGKGTFSKDVKIQPFSKAELEAACQKALGGSWPLPDLHRNAQKTVQATLKESVRVWGRCTSWANKALKTYPVTVTLTCEDQSFPPPPVG